MEPIREEVWRTQVFVLAGASAAMNFVESSTAGVLYCCLKCSATQLLFTSHSCPRSNGYEIEKK